MAEHEAPLLSSLDTAPRTSSCAMIRGRPTLALHRFKVYLSTLTTRRAPSGPSRRYEMLQSAAGSQKFAAERLKHQERFAQLLTSSNDRGKCRLMRNAHSNKLKAEDETTVSGRTISTSNSSLSKDTSFDQSLEEDFFALADPVEYFFWNEEALLVSQLSIDWAHLQSEAKGGDWEVGTDWEANSEWDMDFICGDDNLPWGEENDNLPWQEEHVHGIDPVHDECSTVCIEDQEMALEGAPSCCILTAEKSRTRRPAIRLSLKRRANWKYIRDAKEIVEWQAERNNQRLHKESIANQRRTIRQLRCNYREKQMPLRRGFAAFHVAAKGTIMFSIIREEGENDEQMAHKPTLWEV